MRRYFRKFFVILSVILFSAVSFANARAATVTVGWSGLIVSNSVSSGMISIGDAISGEFSYDDTSVGSSSHPDLFQQYATNHVSSFTVGGLSGSTSSNNITVFDNHSSIGDQFGSLGRGGTYTGDIIGTSTVSQIFIRFTDSTASALSGTNLPSTLDMSDFDLLELSRIDLSSSASIGFRVNSFSFGSGVSSVPLPAAFPLFGAGLAAMGLIGWRRKRKSEKV